MPIYVRISGAWRQFPTTPVGTRLLYFRYGGQWRPIMDLWIRDGGAWHKEPQYSAVMQAPTNLRMNPADTAEHDSIPVAWTQAGNLMPGDYVVRLTDQYGNTLLAPRVSGTARSYTFSNLTQNKAYMVYLIARYPGGEGTKSRPDISIGPLKWKLGQDPQPYQTPVYGWDNDWAWNPGTYDYAGSWDVDHPPIRAVDGNMGTQWLSQPDAATGGYQGDGFRFRMPASHHRLIGCTVYVARGTHTVWYGVYQGGSWKGGNQVYVGKYTPFVHPYLVGQGPTTLVDIRSGGYVTDATGDGSVDLLFQAPAVYSGWTGLRYGAWEIRLILQDWVVTSYVTNYTAAIASGPW